MLVVHDTFTKQKKLKINALMPNYKSSSSFVWYSILVFPYVGGKASRNYPMLFLEHPLKRKHIYFKNHWVAA
jgi:hypothetical protein